MSVFKGYAELYDTFYQAKNYNVECDFIERLFVQYSHNKIHTILDLGCGTGGHLIPLVQRGYNVTGVDQSDVMLATARYKAAGLQVELHQGDIREIDLQQRFDAVIAMFAVIGYMVTNNDLRTAFHTARRHLQPGGLFCFDTWFGPAVLTERPGDRHRIIEKGNEKIIRLVHSELNLLQQTVAVHYTILRLQDKYIVDQLEETHTMRFLFPQETVLLLEEAGFQVLCLCPFLQSDEPLDAHQWSMAVVARAQ